MLRRRLLAACILVACTAAVANSALAPLAASAEVAWKARDYGMFTSICEKIEAAVAPQFGPSFNIALGQFRLGFNEEALKKLEHIETSLRLTQEQKARLSTLRKEVEAYIAYLKQARYTGRATLSKDDPVPPDPCPAQRSGDCVQRSPEESAKHMQELLRLATIAAGYNVPVEDSAIEPEW